MASDLPTKMPEELEERKNSLYQRMEGKAGSEEPDADPAYFRGYFDTILPDLGDEPPTFAKGEQVVLPFVLFGAGDGSYWHVQVFDAYGTLLGYCDGQFAPSIYTKELNLYVEDSIYWEAGTYYYNCWSTYASDADIEEIYSYYFPIYIKEIPVSGIT